MDTRPTAADLASSKQNLLDLAARKLPNRRDYEAYVVIYDANAAAAKRERRALLAVSTYGDKAVDAECAAIDARYRLASAEALLAAVKS